MAEWSTFLIANREVAGSIPGTSELLKVDYVWKKEHLATEEQLSGYLTYKWKI